MTATTKNHSDRSIGMEETEVAHIAGFIDGAGQITAHVHKAADYKIGYTFSPAIIIHLSNHEETMLGKLDAYCEDNFVEYKANEQQSGSFRWQIFNPDGILRFLEPLYPHLVSRHYEATLMMEEVIPAVKENKDKNKQGFYELVKIADELRSVTSYGQDPKYTQEFFADEWQDDLPAV